MASIKRARTEESAPRSGSILPNNPLQSDFDAQEAGSDIDSDERYLVSSARAISIGWSSG